jgi:hypothetical protein
MSEAQTIAKAFFGAQSRRPYVLDEALIKIVIPAGGEWRCEAVDGAICRSVKWNQIEVAYMNPAGDLDDTTEGQIAMATRALPAMDAALRIIGALSSDSANLPLIARIADTVVAYIEQPAPPVREPDDDPPEGDIEDEEGAF